jgi:hypothetical protein
MQGLKLGNAGQLHEQYSLRHRILSTRYSNRAVYMSRSMGVITLKGLSLICMSTLLATIDQISMWMDFIYEANTDVQFHGRLR